MIEICPSHIYRKEPEEIPEVEPPQGGAKWGYCYNHWCVNRQSGEIRRGRTLECDKWRLPTQDDFIELFDYVGNPDVCYKSTDLEFVLDEETNERLIGKATNLMINESAGKKLKSTEEFGFADGESIAGWRTYPEDPTTFGDDSFGFNLYSTMTRTNKGIWQNVHEQTDSLSSTEYDIMGTSAVLWSKEEYVRYPLQHWIGNVYNGDIATIGIPIGAVIWYFIAPNITRLGPDWVGWLILAVATIVFFVASYFYEITMGGGVYFSHGTKRGAVNIKEGTVPGLLDSNKYMFGMVTQRTGSGASIRLIRRTTGGWTVGEKYVDEYPYVSKLIEEVGVDNILWVDRCYSYRNYLRRFEVKK